MSFFDNGTFGSTRVRNNTVVVGAILIVLAFFGAIVYLDATGRPFDQVAGLMLPIVSTVVGVVFVAAKVDTVSHDAGKAANKAEEAADKAEVTAQQTNGNLDDRIQAAIENALAAHDKKGAVDGGQASVQSTEG